MPPHPDDAGGSTRRTPKILLIAAIALLAARIVLSFGEHPEPDVSPLQVHGSFGSTRQAPGAAGAQLELVRWRPINGAPMEAAATGKPILYDFTAAWCPPCKLLNQQVFSDLASAAYINEHFVPVRVLDRSREEGRNPFEVQALQSHFRISGFPTLIVVPRDSGEPVVMDGYGGKERTMAMLAGVVEKAR